MIPTTCKEAASSMLFKTATSLFIIITAKGGSGGSRGGSQGATDPPFWLDQVLTSTDDRLNGTLLPGWRTKITAAVAHLSMP